MKQESSNVRQRHTVKVNEGSGVLIQPMSTEYAYVLTAKHCLQIDKNDSSSDFKKNHDVLFIDGSEISVLSFIWHEMKDIAILIVSPKLDCDLMINSDPMSTNDQVMLCGFPEDRRGRNEEYSSFIYKYVYSTEDDLIFTPDTSGVISSNVVGFSGGGMFSIDKEDKPVLLRAIETKMDGNISREYHGRISAIAISEFERLIENPENKYLGKALAPLLPLHLSNFEYLLEFSFNVARGWTDDDGLNLLLGCLRETATNDIKVNLFPHEILLKFKKYLKVYNRPDYELRSKNLWVSFLELLIVSVLIDKPKSIDLIYVEIMLKSRRLMYIEAEGSWQEYLYNILLSDLKDLNQESIIVAKTLSTQRNVSFTRERVQKLKARQHIARPALDPRSVKNTNRNLSKIHSIVDLSALHADCIEAKEGLYEEDLDVGLFDDNKEANLLEMLSKSYSAFLNVKDDNNAK